MLAGAQPGIHGVATRIRGTAGTAVPGRERRTFPGRPEARERGAAVTVSYRGGRLDGAVR